VLGQAALRSAGGVSAKRWPRSAEGLWAAGISAATVAYLFLLATDTVDGLRGNSQWHIPYVAQPSNGWWWLPAIPGLIVVALPLLPIPSWATIAAAMAAMCAFVYDLFAAQWGGGDNLMAKIINEPTAFHRAAGRITDLSAVLANYPQYLATFEPSSHMPSHPPGDMLLFRWINDLMQASPVLQGATLSWGRTFISGTDMLLQTGNAPYLMAGAIAAIPLIVGLGRLSAVPFAWLAATMEAPLAPATLLFLALPTLLVHVPLLDTVYPLLTTVVLACGVMAVEHRSWRWAAASGLLLASALFYTASAVVIVIPLAVYGLLRAGWRLSWLALPALGGGALVWLLLWLAWGIDMPAIFQFLAKHQADWEARYTYWLWFRWKWYDFVMFDGLPVAALTLKFLIESAARWRAGMASKLDYLFAGWLAMMIYLWLSTTTMAEVGRLWAPLMCFAALFASQALPRFRGALSLTLLLLLAQAMVLNRYLEVINSG
jgi:hypothetical protein